MVNVSPTRDGRIQPGAVAAAGVLSVAAIALGYVFLWIAARLTLSITGYPISIVGVSLLAPLAIIAVMIAIERTG